MNSVYVIQKKASHDYLWLNRYGQVEWTGNLFRICKNPETECVPLAFSNEEDIMEVMEKFNLFECCQIVEVEIYFNTRPRTMQEQAKHTLSWKLSQCV
jgi:hypothetical protein